MIRYTLRCADGHTFDQWFDNMADYDTRQAEHALACPDCGGTDISKALMAPSLGASTRTHTPPPMPAACPATGCGGGMCPAMAD